MSFFGKVVDVIKKVTTKTVDTTKTVGKDIGKGTEHVVNDVSYDIVDKKAESR